MEVGALAVELHIGAASSLKEKRAAIRPIVESARRRFGVSASEVAHHDLWQRACVGFAFVAPSVGRVSEVLDQVERFVWAQPDVTVLSVQRHWLEHDD